MVGQFTKPRSEAVAKSDLLLRCVHQRSLARYMHDFLSSLMAIFELYRRTFLFYYVLHVN